VVATTAAACLIDNTLALATGAATAKSGYFFTYASAGAPPNTYTISGLPSLAGSTGQRGFYTDQTGVIRYAITGAATVASSPIQ
jgi:type IV pilus assembly protein PilA